MHYINLCFTYSLLTYLGLRPQSYDKTVLRPASVLVLVLYFWSYFQHCCTRQGAVWNDNAEMKHLCSFVR